MPKTLVLRSFSAHRLPIVCPGEVFRVPARTEKRETGIVHGLLDRLREQLQLHSERDTNTNIVAIKTERVPMSHSRQPQSLTPLTEGDTMRMERK